MLWWSAHARRTLCRSLFCVCRQPAHAPCVRRPCSAARSLQSTVALPVCVRRPACVRRWRPRRWPVRGAQPLLGGRLCLLICRRARDCQPVRTRRSRCRLVFGGPPSFSAHGLLVGTCLVANPCSIRQLAFASFTQRLLARVRQSAHVVSVANLCSRVAAFGSSCLVAHLCSAVSLPACVWQPACARR